MKTVGAQVALLMGEREFRKNLRALFKFGLLVLVVILVFTLLFHVIMLNVEGQEHSWFTGFYWTLTVMSTLGFGDITFHTDVGRAFSVVVLITGILLLLVVLPFTFIRFFYAPWLEAQVKVRAPRALPEEVTGHVILCGWDTIAPGLVARLKEEGVPYVILEESPEQAARMKEDGLSVVTGELDSVATYRNVNVERARLVIANRDDVTNTNMALTIREAAPDVPVASISTNEDSQDILTLAGSTHVLPLRRLLGEQLANRVNAGHAQTHVVGSFRDLLIAEFPVLNTPLSGKTIRDTRLREMVGVNIVGVWEQARLMPAHPDRVLTDLCLPMAVGTREQMQELDELLYIYDTNHHPVLVMGGGKVGRAACRALRKRDIQVHLIEKEEGLAKRLEGVADKLFIGDAAHLELLIEAGIDKAPAVLLTTNNDAMNVFLAVYCRKLRPDVRIVSRITHEKNMASIRRAGADLALSYSGLGVQTLNSIIMGQELVVLGEGVELHRVPVPTWLAGRSLAESRIGAHTGLSVVGVQEGGELVTNPGATTRLKRGQELLMIGNQDQMKAFRELNDRDFPD